MAKHNTAAQEASESVPETAPETTPSAAPSVIVDTVTVTIAGVDVALPVRFYAGHVINESEARALDAHYRGQFRNNKNAAFGTWEKKVEKDASTAGDNPCTVEKLLSDYPTYVPNVGAGEGESSLDKAKKEAGLITLKQMLAESNTSYEKTGTGTFWNALTVLPTGKGSAEARDIWVQRVMGSKNEKVIAMLQANLDAILAAKKAEKDAEPKAATKLTTTVEANF